MSHYTIWPKIQHLQLPPPLIVFFEWGGKKVLPPMLEGRWIREVLTSSSRVQYSGSKPPTHIERIKGRSKKNIYAWYIQCLPQFNPFIIFSYPFENTSNKIAFSYAALNPLQLYLATFSLIVSNISPCCILFPVIHFVTKPFVMRFLGDLGPERLRWMTLSLPLPVSMQL